LEEHVTNAEDDFGRDQPALPVTETVAQAGGAPGSSTSRSTGVADVPTRRRMIEEKNADQPL
jgi:hypothetical protein